MHACGEAMREEDTAIIEAGFILRLDALNHAIRGLPEDRRARPPPARGNTRPGLNEARQAGGGTSR